MGWAMLGIVLVACGGGTAASTASTATSGSGSGSASNETARAGGAPACHARLYDALVRAASGDTTAIASDATLISPLYDESAGDYVPQTEPYRAEALSWFRANESPLVAEGPRPEANDESGYGTYVICFDDCARCAIEQPGGSTGVVFELRDGQYVVRSVEFDAG